MQRTHASPIAHHAPCALKTQLGLVEHCIVFQCTSSLRVIHWSASNPRWRPVQAADLTDAPATGADCESRATEGDIAVPEELEQEQHPFEAGAFEMAAAFDAPASAGLEALLQSEQQQPLHDDVLPVHDMMSTEAFVEWATSTMDQGPGDLLPSGDLLAECCAQGDVSSQLALPPCAP